MRILIPGGRGQVGTVLARHLTASGHEVTVLSRTHQGEPGNPWRTLQWDGINPGDWVDELNRSDAVIHLSGRTVNTRYTPRHRRQILDSRIVPTLLLGRLIAQSPTPPGLWLNASTATIYRDAYDHAQDEFRGESGDRPDERGTHEPKSLPETFSFSVDVGHRWEEALYAVDTPRARRIRLRTSLVMSPDPGGVFSVLSRLARSGLGGAQGTGQQRVSWMHDKDYARAIEHLLEHPENTDETAGVVNLAAPEAPTNKQFMRKLRDAWRQPVGLPAYTWMLRVGMRVVGTEPELVLKSRWVAPGVLLKHGFEFRFPDWAEAAADLVARSRSDKLNT